MNHYVVWGIVGIISGLVAALADVPLAKPENLGTETSTPTGGIEPWWADVTPKRFVVSFWLSFIGQPGTYITMWLLAQIISTNNEPLGMALKINTFIGCFTGLLCHVVFCIKPLLYQSLHKKLSDDEIGQVINGINPIIRIPMVIGFLTLLLGGTVIVVIAILTGSLPVSKWCLLLNPLVSIIVLMSLKKLKIRIIGPLGTGFALFALLLIIAGLNIPT